MERQEVFPSAEWMQTWRWQLSTRDYHLRGRLSREAKTSCGYYWNCFRHCRDSIDVNECNKCPLWELTPVFLATFNAQETNEATKALMSILHFTGSGMEKNDQWHTLYFTSQSRSPRKSIIMNSPWGTRQKQVSHPCRATSLLNVCTDMWWHWFYR